MSGVLFYVSVAWMTLLFGVGVVLVIRRRHIVDRIQALDVLNLILVALLVLFSNAQQNSYYLDAALVLALLSFVATMAASRYHSEGKLF